MLEATQIEVLRLSHANYGEIVGQAGGGKLYFVHLTKDEADLLLLGEMHSCPSPEHQAALQKAASAMADALLAIENVKVAVEEPVQCPDFLMSRVGLLDQQVQEYLESKISFLERFPDLQASIIHHLFHKQVELKNFPQSTRHAAEDPSDQERYKFMAKINANMATKLNGIANSKSVVVYPVGQYHLSQDDPLPVILEREHGWEMQF